MMIRRFALIVSLIVLFTLLSLALAGGSEEPPAEDNSRIGGPQVPVNIGGVKHVLLFADADISMKLRSAIATDLAQLLAHADKAGVGELNVEKPSHCWEQHDLSIYTLHLPEYRQWLPAVLRDYFGCGIKLGDAFYLIVHEKVIRAYQETLKLRQQHPTKFKQLDAFVALFNDIEARRKAAGTIEQARRFFYWHGREQWHDYETYQKKLGLTPALSVRINSPSLLDVHIGNELKASLVARCIFRISRPSAVDAIVPAMIVYSDGKWSIVADELGPP